MKLFFKLLRLVLTPIVLFVDWVTTPKGVVRPAQQQQAIDTQTKNLTLYHFKACPFCIKTRRAVKRLSLNIEIRDAQKNPQARQELLQGGGEVKVPCLRIDNGGGKITWMYESSDIIDYLREKVAA